MSRDRSTDASGQGALNSSYAGLRTLVTKWNPAAGPTGFEGLVAIALSSVSGLSFRLSASGAQFGRDAASNPAPFAIAMEAKRYTNKIPLQELVAKAALAGFALAGRIDVWVLAATVEVGEGSIDNLSALLDGHGITLLALDWGSIGLPRLATLLAAARADILPWIEKIKGSKLRAEFESELNAVVDDPLFPASLDELARELSAPHLGLDALRAANAAWMQEKFADRNASQATFNQYIAPLDPQRPMIERPEMLSKMQSAIMEWDTHDLVAVLGVEGVGKTWLVAQWWLANSSAPIMLISAGRIADLLRVDRPALDMLASMLALQQGRRDEAAIVRWRRRLENWRLSKQSLSAPRFCVLLDGLNETSGKAWAGILRELAPTVRELGGVLVVTCREGYWTREIERRSRGLLDPFVVTVSEYDDGELERVLSRKALSPSQLPAQVRTFIRNPRICDLALGLLDQLGGDEPLTIERLLLEYWHARLVERGDLLGHDSRDFAKLLMAHAEAYRSQPGMIFDRDEWLRYSGAANRNDGRNLRDDLSDIEEGRFFNSADGSYVFRPEALRFALGLLIVNEIRPTLAVSNDAIGEHAQRIIDAVRGFDAVAEIVASAIGIAALDPSFHDRGVAALILAWLSLQNLTDHAHAGVSVYASVRPNAFLDAFEQRDSERDDGRLLDILLDCRDEQPMRQALEIRISKWLGVWSRLMDLWGAEAGQIQKRQNDRQAKIDANLASLSETETALFHSRCEEHEKPSGLAGSAALMLTGIPQAQFAPGIVGYALASSIAHDFHSPWEQLAWALRLNRLDYPATEAAVRAELRPLMEASATPKAKLAAADALNLLGSSEAAIDAARFWVAPPSEIWRRVEHFCETDPLDPTSQNPSNISYAIDKVAAIDVAKIWNHMGRTGEDHDLEMATPGLTRFSPGELLAVLRAIVLSTRSRSGLQLRQLGWQLPGLSPLFGAAEIAEVTATLSRFEEAGHGITEDDLNFVTAVYVESLLPHCDANGQFDLLLSLPVRIPCYLRFRQKAKPVDEETAERRLREAEKSNEIRWVSRTLLLLSGNRTPLNEVSRKIVARYLLHEDSAVASAAADVATNAEDSGLDDLVLALDPPPLEKRTWKRGCFGRAYASAVVRRKRADLMVNVDPEYVGTVASQLGDAAVDYLAKAIGESVDRLCKPINVEAPADAEIKLELDGEAEMSVFNIDQREVRSKTLEEFFDRLKAESEDKGGRAFNERQRDLHNQFDAFMEGLAFENASTMANAPCLEGLSELADRSPHQMGAWIERMLAEPNIRIRRQVQNLGFTLARAYSSKDPHLSARLFQHLWTAEPIVTVLVGRAKIPLRLLTLFTATDSEPIDTIRTQEFRSALDDRQIERLVAAAEVAGQHAWLTEFVDRMLNSPMPADHALGITVAGLRHSNLHSEGCLARDWSGPFLGVAAEAARYAYERNIWTIHWLELALGASSEDYWRYSTLAAACADRRVLTWGDFARVRLCEREFGGDLASAMAKHSDKISEKREKTLYGLKKPNEVQQQSLQPRCSE